MRTCIVLLWCSLGVILSVPHYYIVVRLTDPAPIHPISAQFKLLQPANSSRVWDCVSGLTPIEYPFGEGKVVKAQSIDMSVGDVVECLGLSVRVVQSEHVPRWEGEDTTCPGLLTSTTQLERSDSGTTEYFQLAPLTTFHVFISRPSDACITEHVQLLPPPGLVFEYSEDMPLSCEVTSQHLDLMTCNLTISTIDDDVISIAVGTPRIQVPLYIFRVGVESLTCLSRCEILNSDTMVVQETSITYQNLSHSVLAPELETYHTLPPTDPVCKDFIIVICVISILLLITTISTVFLLNLTRDLRRKLARATGRRSRITGMKCSPRTPDPLRPEDYSRVHRITNECHHYNTLSLRLSDCGKDSVTTSKSQTFPVYQKLCFNEAEETL